MAKGKKEIKTSQEQPKKPGRNGNPPPKPTRGFDVLGQPPPEAKKAGWDRKKQGEALVKLILNHTPTDADTDISIFRKAAAAFFGIEESDVTLETIMNMQQAKKAITECDTAAYKAVMDRAHGTPTQKTDVTSGGEPIKQVFKIGNQTIEF